MTMHLYSILVDNKMQFFRKYYLPINLLLKDKTQHDSKHQGNLELQYSGI